jgi:hypothetical protein
MQVVAFRNLKAGNRDLGRKFGSLTEKLLERLFSENLVLRILFRNLGILREIGSGKWRKEKGERSIRSLSFNLAKINMHSSSFMKFRGVL